jgi:hypothetical protein
VIVPGSVAEAHERQQVILRLVEDLAGSRLRELCRRQQWLFDERHKPVESALAKLEAGASPSLALMDDLWAALVVVPTAAEVPAAAAQVLQLFDGVQKPSRRRDAQAFPYDDVHVIAALGSKVSQAVASPEVLNRRFEVQIHTGLQYAWWRATHDTVYKGGSRDWRTVRAASQARASLELLDAVLADLHGAGQLQSALPGPEAEPDTLLPEKWLDLWRPEDRPRDVLRFCDTVMRLIRACGLSPEELQQYLRGDSARDLIGQRDLTPGQAVTLATARLVGADFRGRLKRAGVRVLVTPEMAQWPPDLSDLGADSASGP